jgi:hypothetical protein
MAIQSGRFRILGASSFQENHEKLKVKALTTKNNVTLVARKSIKPDFSAGSLLEMRS